MSEDQKFSIRLHVYDTEMVVKINREDEEYCRKAELRITETVNNYAMNFKDKRSEKEILYMALIDIALQLEFQEKRNDTSPYKDIIVRLTEEMKEMLNNDKQ